LLTREGVFASRPFPGEISQKMKAALVGLHDPELTQFRLIATRRGLECPPGLALSYESALKQLVSPQGVCDLIFLNCAIPSEDAAALIHRLRRQSQALVVAVGHGIPAEQVLRLIRCGACDYLDLRQPQGLEDDLLAMLGRLRQESSGGSGKGRLISITSASGGCGVSTLAVNLSIALARRMGSCGLVDLKLRGGDLAVLMNMMPRHTLADVCKQRDQMDATLIDQSLCSHPSGVRLLASPPFLENHGKFDAETIAKAIRLIQAAFPQVIVDVEDVFHREQQETLLASDHVIAVMRLDFPCLLRTQRMLQYLETVGVPSGNIHLVVNRFGLDTQISQKQCCEALGRSISSFLPEDYEAMISAVNVGNPVLLEVPSAKVSKAILTMSERYIA